MASMSPLSKSAAVKSRRIGFQTTRYADRLRAQLVNPGSAGEISRLNFELGELYAKAVLRAVRSFGSVELIGCHGQTVYHEGGKHTLQIGEAAVIAERTGAPVVSNFRARDIAAGGQGAPLVPFVDYLLFRHPRAHAHCAQHRRHRQHHRDSSRSIAPKQVIAFDTGPGNMVIDALAQAFSKGKLRCDRDGKIAASGKPDVRLLDRLLADPYYRQRPPKSAGREQYGAEFIAAVERLPSRRCAI